MADALRDLVYLDFERVRSLVAQLGLETALPSAGRLGRSDGGETRALQTAVFSALQKALLEGGRLLQVGPEFDYAAGWKPEAFKDGQLVQVSGMIRILDYPWLASVMETLPRMLKVTHRAELSALKAKREAHQVTQVEVDQKVKEHQAQLKDLETWKMEELTEVVRELFGQSVRVKVLPYGAKGGEMLVGSCEPGLFLESPAMLSQNYGTDINAGWTVVGMLNLTPAAPTPPLATGNAVEDMFERLALAVNRIHRVAGSPDFPALAMTPLAIYRSL